MIKNVKCKKYRETISKNIFCKIAEKIADKFFLSLDIIFITFLTLEFLSFAMFGNEFICVIIDFIKYNS